MADLGRWLRFGWRYLHLPDGSCQEVHPSQNHEEYHSSSHLRHLRKWFLFLLIQLGSCPWSIVIKHIVIHFKPLSEMFWNKWIYYSIITYEFGSLLQSQEKMFLIVVHIGVCVHASHFLLVFVAGVPIDWALNFTFEVGGPSSWNQCHLDILVRVWLKVSIHWFKLQVITAHQTGFQEVEFQFLGLAQIV